RRERKGIRGAEPIPLTATSSCCCRTRHYTVYNVCRPSAACTVPRTDHCPSAWTPAAQPGARLQHRSQRQFGDLGRVLAVTNVLDRCNVIVVGASAGGVSAPHA